MQAWLEDHATLLYYVCEIAQETDLAKALVAFAEDYDYASAHGAAKEFGIHEQFHALWAARLIENIES